MPKGKPYSTRFKFKVALEAAKGSKTLKRRTTVSSPDHKVYPYLLRNLPIARPNQVWSTDITYIPMLRGFMYLVAITD
jgi:transposase InsO family protein